MGGAELLRPGELLAHHVHGDDPARADQARGLDRVEPDAAAAPDGDAGARRDARAIEDGAGAGEHAAAHEAHDVERRVLPHGDDALLGEHGMGGVPGDLEEVVERLPVPPEARRPVHHEPARPVAERAERRLAVDAVAALAARGDVARADVVARLHGLDRGSHALDDARGLVAQHDGQGMRVVAGDHVVVAVADAVRRPPDQHLVRARLQHLDVLDDDRLVDLVQDRGSSRAWTPSLVGLGHRPPSF